MDEIALLQAQLAAVQQQESALKLSDHNVIDLLTKLQQLGKIQFVHTLTGKQILTPKQVEREIEDHVALNGGRISLSELQQLLSIDRTYVERHVAQVTRANRHSSGANASQYFVVNTGEEVVTNWYLDAIMEDTNTLLQESGTMTVGELAQQFGFAVEYMKEVVASRLGSILKAQERGNVLYTNSFVASQKAQIRGVFAAITRPTFVPDLVRAYRFDDKVVDQYLPELIHSRVLMGSLRGREYVPFVFLEAQRESMFSFFAQNGYLDHARALQLQVTRPYDFLKKRFPDAIALKDCVVSHALQLQLEGSIELAVHDASFVDVRTVLPSAVHAVDASMLLSKSSLVARGTGDAIQLADAYAVSKAFLAASLEVFKKDAATKAQHASLTQQRSGGVVTSAGDARNNDNAEDEEDEDAEHDGGGRRGKKGGKKGGKANVAAEDASEISDKKTKQRGKSGGAKGKRGKNDDDDKKDEERQQQPRSRKQGGNSEAASLRSITPSTDAVQAMLAQAFPQTEDDDELLEHVADHLAVEIDAIYSAALATALSSVHRGDAVSLRELRKKFEDQLDELLTLLSIYEKSYNKLELHVDAKDASGLEQLKLVEIHLLETIGKEIATLVTSFVAASQNVEMDDDVPPFDALVARVAADASESSLSSATETETPRSQFVMAALSDPNKKALEQSSLSQTTTTALVKLWTLTTAGRRSLSDLTAHVPLVTSALSVPLRKLDRKRERHVVFAYRHAVVGSLETLNEDEEIAAVAALVVQLFFQQTTGLPLSLPRDNVAVAAMVVEAFAASVPAAAADRLRGFVAMAARIGSGADDDDARVQWPTLVEQVRGLVLAKDIGAAVALCAAEE